MYQKFPENKDLRSNNYPLCAKSLLKSFDLCCCYCKIFIWKRLLLKHTFGDVPYIKVMFDALCLCQVLPHPLCHFTVPVCHQCPQIQVLRLDPF